MRILLCNKFYYRRGGDCIYTMSLERLLKSKGHDVAIYSMNYQDNENSEWSKFWPSYMNKLDVLSRPFGSKQVVDGFTKLLNDFKPDVVHLNNIHTQLSPIIAKLAHMHGCRVIWTLHDTKLVCPSYTCMRNGKWCTDCFSDKTAVIRHRCMPGSLLGAIVGYFEQKKWNKEKLQEYTDIFLAPSQFMMDTCVAGGYNANKYRVICNFIDVDKIKNPSYQKGGYYVYLGRVNEEKGLHTLCQAANQLPYKLVVIGDGELLSQLKEQYKVNSKIIFKGNMQWNDFRPLLEGARFMVLPSEWSENNPLTVIESQSLGTPVLGARIGGIPELIQEKISGMTFESGNTEDLKAKIELMFNSSFDYKEIARQAVAKYSSDVYYEKLMEIYMEK